MPSAAVRRLSPLQWAGGGLGGCAVLLALLGLLAPASAFFFPLLSLWASVGLFVLALCALRVAGAELDFFHKAVVSNAFKYIIHHGRVSNNRAAQPELSLDDIALFLS